MTLTETLLHCHIRFDPADPAWPDRDRLVLPCERADVPARSATVVTGPAGLAFGAALGLAMAERLLAARFGRSLVDHRTWLVAGLRDVAAGTAQEAAFVAGALPLGRLAVLARLPETDAPQARRRMLAGFAAAGWTVRTIAEGDEAAADAALSACLRSQKPTLIAEIGQGVHGTAAGLPARPAEADDQGTRAAAKRGPGARRAWLKRLRRHPNREAFAHAQSGYLPPGWQRQMQTEEAVAAGATPPAMAAVIQSAIGRLAAMVPELTGLPLREVPGLPAASASAFGARQLVWDGLDQAAAAGALGMALHGGVLPVCWGLPEAAALRPSLIAAAGHRVRLLHIHAQDRTAPVLAIPGVMTFLPGDAQEAVDCLSLAVRHMDGPCVLALSEQQAARPPQGPARPAGRGAYILGNPGRRDVTLLAAGATVATALTVQAMLMARQVSAMVAAMPCRALFELQDLAYRQALLGSSPVIALGGEDGAMFAGLIGSRDVMLTGDLPAAQMVDAVLRHLQRSSPELEPL